MPHRDPETGQFLSHSNEYTDIEVVTFGATVGVEAANLSGSTGFSPDDQNQFEGVEAIDYDEIVDRNEELHLLEAHHVMSVFANSTETADGTVAVSVELAADPSLSPVVATMNNPGGAQNVGDDAVTTSTGGVQDDTIDIIGRPLSAVGFAPFSDGSTGVGGAGSEGHDEYTSRDFPEEYGRFHPRDEAFFNGHIEAWNIDDAGIHVNLGGQHVYGVIED